MARLLKISKKDRDALYKKLFRAQGGVCWFCGRPPKRRRLCLDHNHKTGKIRGLLCAFCNHYVVGRHDRKSALRLHQYMEAFDG